MKKYGGKGKALPVHEIKKFSRQIIEVNCLSSDGIIFILVVGNINPG